MCSQIVIYSVLSNLNKSLSAFKFVWRRSQEFNGEGNGYIRVLTVLSYFRNKKKTLIER